MPLYTYECDTCGNQMDRLFPVHHFPETMPCKCGDRARKVITVGHGGIQTDGDVKWLASARMNLQPDYEKPVETRGEYKRYLKDRGIVERG